jgi:N-acetylmuramoyl-L-alanine amidase
MATKPYVVRSGDYLTAIAAAHGVSADAVWSNAANESLAKLRPNREILAPGDVVYIPVVARQWLGVQVGTTNTFSATAKRVPVRVLLRDELGPIKNERYVATLARGSVEGTTDGDGRVTFDVDVLDRVVPLELPDRAYSADLQIGGIDPLETASGVAARLYHLGYFDAPAPEGSTGGVDAAVRALQLDAGLPVTGAVDADTANELRSRFGG